MDEFLEDLKTGEIQLRDRWQFELKSEFYPSKTSHTSTYSQEFYFFVPNALQINSSTYTKEDFYSDLTNFIRYKTPEFSLQEIIEKSSPLSPYNHLYELASKKEDEDVIRQAIMEIKLLGSVIRSSIRERVYHILNDLHSAEEMDRETASLCRDIISVRKALENLEDTLFKHFNNPELKVAYNYFDEFFSNTIDYYLTGLLDELSRKPTPLSEESKELAESLIISEKKHREIYGFKGTHLDRREHSEEILYKSGLLKKFIMDALMLPTFRASLQQRYGHYIGGFAAGIAMLVYILLFAWFGTTFVITSQPFIILTVVTYILKDRLKEGLKAISYQKALQWFSDFTTEIRSPDEDQTLGDLKESFTFINPNNLPKEIKTVRDRDFHFVLETIKRPEQIIYYKQEVNILTNITPNKKLLNAVNIILRYNIQDFLQKAGNPYQTYTTLNSETKSILHMRLPKVYHLNIILKTVYTDRENKKITELKKFRVILDKNGIKHIDYIKPKTA